MCNDAGDKGEDEEELGEHHLAWSGLAEMEINEVGWISCRTRCEGTSNGMLSRGMCEGVWGSVEKGRMGDEGKGR